MAVGALETKQGRDMLYKYKALHYISFMSDYSLPEKFLEPYDQNNTESSIYEMWNTSGFFTPEKCIEAGITNPEAEPFTIVLPPPNTTGILHTGHSLMIGVQDILVRYHRMNGKKALWLPGTDHAAIATDAKVTKQLEKKGIKKREIGREKFLEHVNTFVQENRGAILDQTRVLGASLDWSREAFTMDETRNYAVTEAFVRLYNMGLIYQGDRIVNWDTKAQTVISDDEVQREERPGKIYTFKYSKNVPIAISSTRPETKVGDVAIAVHPDDTRYSQYVGESFTTTFCGKEIALRVIADAHIDPEFGTGALGVTPAHSAIDAEIAERHKLKGTQVINEYGKMIDDVGEISGMKVVAAREHLVAWLTKNDLLIEQEDIIQEVPISERTGVIIEALPKKQWWLNVTKEFSLENSHIQGVASGETVTVKKILQHVVREKHVQIIPERFEKNYFSWIDNLRDWCLSRQIWFGHPVPAYYHRDNPAKIHVGHSAPDTTDQWVQDTDVLDTWFSSGLWTFSTLGWPEATPDLQTYHPTQVLETGYDIIFPWVARMILMSTTLLGEIPFETVYFHGLVRDEQGRKVSKSLGNNIDPRDMVTKFGADSLRMAQIVGVGPGNDNNLGENKIKAYRKFSNKLWNVSRLVLSHTRVYETAPDRNTITNDSYQAYLAELETVTQSVTEHIDKYRLYLAAEELYHYVWDAFAQDILEKEKEVIKDPEHEYHQQSQDVLYIILTTTLKLLHPFMPFITEEIWQSLPHVLHQKNTAANEQAKHATMLMISSWPYPTSQSSSGHS